MTPLDHREMTPKARHYLKEALTADLDPLDLARQLAWIADELPATSHGLEKVLRREVERLEAIAGVE